LTLPFFVLADAHGIETFMDYNAYQKTHFPFLMRAELNRQREAIVFVVRLTKRQGAEISDLLETGKVDGRPTNKKQFITGMKMIKKFVGSDMKKIIFPKGKEEEYLASYERIPDKKLDRWRTKA
tara:strand:+ start:651 stop:1022 length:372 start_codon:yes stop_codon:yes gene_type:complete